MIELNDSNVLNKNSADNFIGKKCYYVDKVTFKKILDGKHLGICVAETINKVDNLPLCWFEKSFLGFKWIYKSDVRS